MGPEKTSGSCRLAPIACPFFDQGKAARLLADYSGNEQPVFRKSHGNDWLKADDIFSAVVRADVMSLTQGSDNPNKY